MKISQLFVLLIGFSSISSFHIESEDGLKQKIKSEVECKNPYFLKANYEDNSDPIIGYAHHISFNDQYNRHSELTISQADELFETDFKKTVDEVGDLLESIGINEKDISVGAKHCLLDFAFEIGMPNFSGQFRLFIKLQKKDLIEAAKEILEFDTASNIFFHGEEKDPSPRRLLCVNMLLTGTVEFTPSCKLLPSLLTQLEESIKIKFDSQPKQYQKDCKDDEQYDIDSQWCKGVEDCPYYNMNQRQILKDTQCVSCPIGYISIKNKCIECANNEHTKTKNSCLNISQCGQLTFKLERMIVKDHKCKVCPDGFISKGNECVECSKNQWTRFKNECYEAKDCLPEMNFTFNYSPNRRYAIEHECFICADSNTIAVNNKCVKCPLDTFGNFETNICHTLEDCAQYFGQDYAKDEDRKKVNYDRVENHLCIPVIKEGFLPSVGDRPLLEDNLNPTVKRCLDFINGFLDGYYGGEIKKIENLISVPDELNDTFHKWQTVDWNQPENVKNAFDSTCRSVSSVWKGLKDFTDVPSNLESEVTNYLAAVAPEVAFAYQAGKYTFGLYNKSVDITSNIKGFYENVKSDNFNESGRSLGRLLKTVSSSKKMKLKFLS
jgi:hypothetical protein